MTNYFPKISIITPSYNQVQFIEETILSILNQNYTNLEYIIIDGGSTDGSVDVIKKYAGRVTYWESEKDEGTFDAINKALKMFTGDYWCVVNSDDKLAPGTVARIVEEIRQSSADWITGGIEFIGAESEKLGSSIPAFPAKVQGKYFLNECWIYHPVTFLSRDLFNKVGQFRKMDIMDYDYWIRAEEEGFVPTIVPMILGSLRYHVNCKSMDFLKIYRSKINLLSEKISNDGMNELTQHINDLELAYLQSKLKLLLFNKKYLRTLSLLFNKVIGNPSLLLRRWPYGLLKRFMSGIAQEEVSPIHYLKNLK